jgi:hypothetical protein
MTTARFDYLANQICRSAHSGVSLGPPPAGAQQLKSYASAALPPTMRAYDSLVRLVLRTERTGSAGRLLVDYQALIGLYERLAGRSPGARPSRPGGGPAHTPKPPHKPHRSTGSRPGPPSPGGPVTGQQIKVIQGQAAAAARSLQLPLCAPPGA